MLKPLIDQDLQTYTQQLTPLDAARLHSAVAYSLSTLEVCYLRLIGVQHQTHEVVQDLQAVRTSMNKITETAKMLEEIAAEKERLENEKLQKKMADEGDKIEKIEKPEKSEKTPEQIASRKILTAAIHSTVAPGKAKKRKA
jgi:regulator of replication initiation timing